jgi:hypothetical protein
VTTLERRLRELERPLERPCLGCELARLNGAPPSVCTHPAQVGLAEALLALNGTDKGTSHAKP